jgi:uncharacterized protein YqgV (UPF0045/DUF77 family)
MSRLVLVRVGDPNGLWSTLRDLGKWSSPECHQQAVRNSFVEGYNVYCLFVGTGDIPIMAAKVKNVREKINSDIDMPLRNEIGELKTIIEFDLDTCIDLVNRIISHYIIALEYVKYKVGSQILIPTNFSENFILYFNNIQTDSKFIRNITVLNPEYWTNNYMNGC